MTSGCQKFLVDAAALQLSRLHLFSNESSSNFLCRYLHNGPLRLLLLSCTRLYVLRKCYTIPAIHGRIV